jgi:hypothetical protein
VIRSDRSLRTLLDMLTVKTLDDEVVALEDIIDGRLTVVAFLRHFG